MKKAFIIMTFSAMAAGCADNSIPKAQLPELDTSNPLLAEWNTPHQTPPFSEIKLSDYEPAFDAAIACSRAEVEAIVKNPKKPTFGNTIVALERQGELLNRIAGLFFNLLEADTSDEMQEIAQRVQPKLTELSNDISLNPELFARVKAVYGKPGRGLSKEDKKLLEDTYQSFARNGAALSDADKELYRKYSSELSAATLQFGQNALAATNAFSINITDPKVVAELPDFVKEGMAADAKARGEKGWTVTLQAPSYVPFLTYAAEGIGAADLAWHLIYNTIEPAQLLTLGRGTIVEPKNLRLLSFSAGLDLWLIIGAGLALVAILRGRRRDENERKALTFIAGGVLFAVASTDFFPWSYVALIDHGLMDYMQFTWRLLMLAVVLLALAAGYGVARFFEEKPEYGVLLTLCLTAALALPTLTTETQSDLYLRYGETYNPYMYGTEYTMEGTNFAYTRDKNPHVEQGEISLTAYAKRGTKIEMQVEAKTDGVISVPLFGYDGYCAQADGQELETGLDENKRLTVVVPAGTKGEVKLWYAGKRWWRISDAVSLLTALALIAARIQHRRKAQKA